MLVGEIVNFNSIDMEGTGCTMNGKNGKHKKMPQEDPKYISLKLSEALYDLVAEHAGAIGLPMNEAIVRIVAEKFGRPELGYVPRKGHWPTTPMPEKVTV